MLCPYTKNWDILSNGREYISRNCLDVIANNTWRYKLLHVEIIFNSCYNWIQLYYSESHRRNLFAWLVGGSVVVLNFFVKNVNPKKWKSMQRFFIRVKLFLNSVVSLSLSLFNQIKEVKNHWLSIAVNSLTHYPFGMKKFFFFLFQHFI